MISDMYMVTYQSHNFTVWYFIVDGEYQIQGYHMSSCCTSAADVRELIKIAYDFVRFCDNPIEYLTKLGSEVEFAFPKPEI